MTRMREGELLGGRYRIEGAGHDAWAATDLTSGRRVHASLIARAAVPNARRAMDLSSPHVVRVLDVGETAEGAAWVIRDHVASASLTRHLAKHGALRVAEAVDVALALCDAIAEASANGLAHGALDASVVHLAWSASGLVDIQVVGVGTTGASPPREDVRSIAKILEAALAGHSVGVLPAELVEVITRAKTQQIGVLELAEAIVPYASDRDFASDRISARRTRSLTSKSVFAEGGYAYMPPPAAPGSSAADVSPAVRDVEKRRTPSYAPARDRDCPTVIAPRPSFPRRRVIRALGIITAALSVALLVLIGTEGARLAYHRGPQALIAPTLAADAPPPPVSSIVLPEPSAVAVRANDLPEAPARTTPPKRASKPATSGSYSR